MVPGMGLTRARVKGLWVNPNKTISCIGQPPSPLPDVYQDRRPGAMGVSPGVFHM